MLGIWMLCVISSQLPLLHLTYDSMTLILSCVCGNSMTGVCVCVCVCLLQFGDQCVGVGL